MNWYKKGNKQELIEGGDFVFEDSDKKYKAYYPEWAPRYIAKFVRDKMKVKGKLTITEIHRECVEVTVHAWGDINKCWIYCRAKTFEEVLDEV